MSWVTRGSTGGADPINKPAACRWLRSSSYNCADQGSFVIESLYKNFGPRSAVAAPSAASDDGSPPAPAAKTSERVFAGILRVRVPAGPHDGIGAYAHWPN
ncbi:hypothetical protein BST14_00830 [Mycobacterium arosiense ATCC BAA-1401 = DSM 45069]|uniref:Uncharacterized protein n=1 Tax=Mycobacterium arosiense ATCC BAA-1401 = DSM 45069 TaxID=1265311 RepID=A0A1W9ZTF5_MYCAI|nr:hypothetical protein BST14_00830 [Mycobacterium arosiense ATCC BAA-1401 = DSM 45069]